MTEEKRNALLWANKLINHEIMAIQCGTDKNHTKYESAQLKILFQLLYEINHQIESEA